MCEFIVTHYKLLKPLKTVFSMDFRIRSKSDRYIRVLNQSCLLRKDSEDMHFKVLSLNTDITHIKNSTNIEFNYINKGDDITFQFPQEFCFALYPSRARNLIPACRRIQQC
jgi:hypothetical protein